MVGPRPKAWRRRAGRAVAHARHVAARIRLGRDVLLVPGGIRSRSRRSGSRAGRGGGGPGAAESCRSAHPRLVAMLHPGGRRSWLAQSEQHTTHRSDPPSPPTSRSEPCWSRRRIDPRLRCTVRRRRRRQGPRHRPPRPAGGGRASVPTVVTALLIGIVAVTVAAIATLADRRSAMASA